MLPHDIYIRVRYGETDQMGYLYHGHYATYYEVGRTEWIRHHGLRYRDLEDVHGILMPVMRLDIRYVRPARYDDLLRVTTTLRKLPEQQMTFASEIHNEADELVSGATVRLGFIDRAGGSRAAPDYLIAHLRTLL